MKKSLLALAVLGTFAGAAAAQSSVTLFGVVDLSLKYVENGDIDNKSMGSDGIQSSRFGVRGVEDLGGGLRAGFHLESGIDAGNGANTGATFWQRRSTVSLLGGFGEVRLGRDLNPIFLTHGTYDPFGTVGVGTSFNIISQGLGTGAGTMVRTSNAVSYFTPTTIPFYAHVMVGPSEGCNTLPTTNPPCAASTTQKFFGGRLGFGTGPFDISIGASKTEITSALDFEQQALGTSFDFGFMKLFFYYLHSENSVRIGTEPVAREQNIAQLGFTFPIGQSLIKLQVATSEMKGGAGATTAAGFRDGDDATMFALQYNYNLSKRTALYASASRISNDANAAFATGGTFQTPSARPAVGFDSTGVEFGIRHAF